MWSPDSVRYGAVSLKLFITEGPPSLLCKITREITKEHKYKELLVHVYEYAYISFPISRFTVILSSFAEDKDLFKTIFFSEQVFFRKPTETKSLFKTELIKCKRCPHTETSQLICHANQLTAFYLRATLALNGLIYNLFNILCLIRDLLVDTYATFPEKLAFLTPPDMQMCVSISGG